MKARIDWYVTLLLVIVCGACAAVHVLRMGIWLGLWAWGISFATDPGQVFGTTLIAGLSSAVTAWLSRLLLKPASMSKDKVQ